MGGGSLFSSRRALILGVFFTVLAVSAEAAAEPRMKTKAGGCGARFEPVCARTSQGALATYLNDCLARADDAAVIAKQACAELTCPPELLPVCGRKGGANRTYPNACLAGKDEAFLIAYGACEPDCVETGGLVCALDETGKRSEYGNACQARMAGLRVLHWGRCAVRRACASDGIRICAIDMRSGKEETFVNLCRAEFANAIFLHRGKCGAKWRQLLKRLKRDGA